MKVPCEISPALRGNQGIGLGQHLKEGHFRNVWFTYSEIVFSYISLYMSLIHV